MNLPFGCKRSGLNQASAIEKRNKKKRSIGQDFVLYYLKKHITKMLKEQINGVNKNGCC